MAVNKQSRRSRVCELETKAVVLAIYERKLERELQEVVSTGQVVIRQQVLAMFLCAMGKSRKTLRAETADQSLK